MINVVVVLGMESKRRGSLFLGIGLPHQLLLTLSFSISSIKTRRHAKLTKRFNLVLLSTMTRQDDLLLFFFFSFCGFSQGFSQGFLMLLFLGLLQLQVTKPARQMFAREISPQSKDSEISIAKVYKKFIFLRYNLCLLMILLETHY